MVVLHGLQNNFPDASWD